MNLIINKLSEEDHTAWDAYVHNHPKSNLYHLSGWKTVIEKTYGHRTYYLMAVDTQSSALSTQSLDLGPKSSAPSTQHLDLSPQHSIIVGILPLVHMRHFIFGNKLVSIPFFDMGGLLADNQQVEKALLAEAIALGRKLNADTIELRHSQPHPWINGMQAAPGEEQFTTHHKQQTNLTNSANSTNPTNITNLTNSTNPTNLTNQTVITPSTFSARKSTNKVRMLLELPDSSDELMKSFKSKLRSQIKRPIKEGLSAKTGGVELLDDFYAVFCVNMRDLGSPVHAKRMMQTVLTVFDKNARLVVIYKESTPVACSLVIGFEDTLENPWASSLREFSRLSPNMLLYWSMLAFACDNGYRFFDFGRSTPGEGTYKFKSQWGAKPAPLNWHTIDLHGKETGTTGEDKSKFGKAIEYWQKLPVPITRLVGPMIRKHIAL
jgi:FemAB-related protein (PEP-CTERM system-associated)